MGGGIGQLATAMHIQATLIGLYCTTTNGDVASLVIISEYPTTAHVCVCVCVMFLKCMVMLLDIKISIFIYFPSEMVTDLLKDNQIKSRNMKQ
jgi:hypothetical protein